MGSFLFGVFNSTLQGASLQQTFLKLSSSSYCEREVGQTELLRWGRMSPDTAKLQLFERARFDNEPEVRARCMDVLRELVIDDYLKEGSGYIGVGLSREMMKVPQDLKLRSVIRVTQVQPNTPASRAGILPGDIIVGLNQQIWYELDADLKFQETIKAMKPNTKVCLRILRNGVISGVSVALIRRPSLLNTPFFLNTAAFDLEGSERAAKEAYFRKWVDERS